MSAYDTVAAQIGAQSELGHARPLGGQAPDALGEQVAQGVAASPQGITSVDPEQLLAIVQQLQQQVQDMADERAAEKTAHLPGVVQVAKSILDDLTLRDSALGSNSRVLEPAVAKAKALADAASAAADSGDITELVTLGRALESHLARGANAANSADISYMQQLGGEDLPEAAATMPKPARVPAAAQPSQATPARGPVVHTFN
jgi:hypothetical protein